MEGQKKRTVEEDAEKQRMNNNSGSSETVAPNPWALDRYQSVGYLAKDKTKTQQPLFLFYFSFDCCRRFILKTIGFSLSLLDVGPSRVLHSLILNP